MDHRICKLFGFAGEIPYEDIPDVNAKIIAILPIIAGEVSLDTLIKLSKKAPIALDVQGFVRVPEGDDLLFKPWKDMDECLKHVTFLKVDHGIFPDFFAGSVDNALYADFLKIFGRENSAVEAQITCNAVLHLQNRTGKAFVGQKFGDFHPDDTAADDDDFASGLRLAAQNIMCIRNVR